MKSLMVASLVALGICAAVEAAPTDPVTQADLQSLIERLAKLEAENKAQAARIAELEGRQKGSVAAEAEPKAEGEKKADESTTVSESGSIYTVASGKMYHLVDATANIFEPLSESGLKITPYGWLAMEATYNSHSTEVDVYTDYVRPKSDRSYKGGTMTLSVQDSILGMNMETPEAINGWKFGGTAQFDFAGDHANDYQFHWRHLYMEASHESGWSILGGQTWHLWKMVSPSEIDGAWMENTGYPYRRSPQFRVTKKWEWEDSSLEARVGLVKNGPGMGGDRDGDGNEDNSASRWCLVEGAIVYDHRAAWEDDASHRWLVGLGGMYGRDRSARWSGVSADGTREFNGNYDEYDSQMIMAAFSVPFLNRFTFVGQIFAGENLGGVQAGVGQRVAYVAPNRKGREVSTVGGFGEIQFKLNDQWSFAGGYGFDNPDNSEAREAKGILHNDRAYVDVFYRVTSNLRFGLEYARLSTQWKDEGRANDDRVQFSAFYDF